MITQAAEQLIKHVRILSDDILSYYHGSGATPATVPNEETEILYERIEGLPVLLKDVFTEMQVNTMQSDFSTVSLQRYWAMVSNDLNSVINSWAGSICLRLNTVENIVQKTGGGKEYFLFTIGEVRRLLPVLERECGRLYGVRTSDKDAKGFITEREMIFTLVSYLISWSGAAANLVNRIISGGDNSSLAIFEKTPGVVYNQPQPQPKDLLSETIKVYSGTFKRNKILSTRDHAAFARYLTHLVKHNTTPPHITPINTCELPSGHIRLSLHRIWKHYKLSTPICVDFLYKVFPQKFADVNRASLIDKHFADKVANYDNDIRDILANI